MKKKQAENPLHLLQELVNNIPDVIYFKDKQGNLILVNKAHASGLGLTPEEVFGKTDYDFFPKDQAESMTRDDQKVMETGEPVVDVIERTTQPNGTHHIVSTTKIPRKDDSGQIIGIMGVTRDITERVNREEQFEVERKQAAESLRKLNQHLEFEKRKLEQILYVEEELNKINKFENLIEFVVHNTAKILEARRCSLMLLSDLKKNLEMKASIGIDQEYVRKFNGYDQNSVSYMVSLFGLPILVTDIEQDMRFHKANGDSYRSKSFVSVPIKLGDEILGVINVSDKIQSQDESGVFTELDLKILDMFSRHVAVAIENANLYRELNFMTISDPMTNMYNYRYFAKNLDRELSRVNRYGGALSLLMIDIDDFKSYNDSFGHLEGDRLLKDISNVFANNLRGTDIACRYAGDEFVVILPETTYDQARIIAQKILSRVRELALNRPVTISIGLAQYHSAMDRHQFTLEADAALYRAKRLGKNCVCC